MKNETVVIVVLPTVLNILIYIVGLYTVPKTLYDVAGIRLTSEQVSIINLNFAFPRQWSFMVYTLCLHLIFDYLKLRRENGRTI